MAIFLGPTSSLLTKKSEDDEKGEALEAACHLMSDLAELLEGVYQGLHVWLDLIFWGDDFVGWGRKP